MASLLTHDGIVSVMCTWSDRTYVQRLQHAVALSPIRTPPV